MKIRYIIAALLLALAAACSEDEGNYDYRKLNTIELKGLAEEYSVDQFDTLKIDDLELNFSVEENADVAYEWVLKSRSHGSTPQVISTERNCRGYITEAPAGYDAWLCVTDLTNGLKYYQEFDVKVNSSFQNGLYVLSEAEDGTAVISMQRRDKAGEPLRYDLFESSNPELGKLGKKPVQISYASSTICVVCGEGERKILHFDNKKLQLQQYWDESTIDDYAGSFVPEFFANDAQGGGMILSEGKLFLFNHSKNKTLYSPVGGYDFSWVGANPSLSTEYHFAYDEDSQKFKKLEPGKNALCFDKVSTIEDLNTAGQTYWNQGTLANSDYDKICYPILFDPATGKEHYYRIYVYGKSNEDYTEYKQFFEYTEEMVRPAILDENSVCLLSKEKYWYASKGGNKIIRYYLDETGEIQDWYTGLQGEVTAMMFDKKEKRVFVATYDGTKSYIYEIDAAEPKQLLNEPLELPGKVVSMCVVGSWKF